MSGGVRGGAGDPLSLLNRPPSRFRGPSDCHALLSRGPFLAGQGQPTPLSVLIETPPQVLYSGIDQEQTPVRGSRDRRQPLVRPR